MGERETLRWLNTAKHRYVGALDQPHGPVVERLIEKKWAERRGCRVFITRAGFERLNYEPWPPESDEP